LNEFDGLLVVLHAALLRAHLDDALVFLRGSHRHVPFADELAHGLLEIDVLAGLAGGNHRQHMPLLVGGDHHGIDILVFKQLAIVRIRGDAVATGKLAAVAHVLGVHVADSREAGARNFGEVGNNDCAPAGSATDEAKINGVVYAGSGVH
jgi:hypothetical protein